MRFRASECETRHGGRGYQGAHFGACGVARTRNMRGAQRVKLMPVRTRPGGAALVCLVTSDFLLSLNHRAVGQVTAAASRGSERSSTAREPSGAERLPS